jgi:hypothetical protein
MMSDATLADHGFVEANRLDVQDALYGPASRRLLHEAGIEPGMRVLDLGSGSGAVVRHRSHLVGPSGSVVGVERNARLASLTAARFESEGFRNATMRHESVESMDAGDRFDAVVGRFVLRELRAPIDTLHRLMAPFGIATTEQMDLDTLAVRLRAACSRAPGTVMLMAPMIAAWSRVA